MLLIGLGVEGGELDWRIQEASWKKGEVLVFAVAPARQRRRLLCAILNVSCELCDGLASWNVQCEANRCSVDHAGVSGPVRRNLLLRPVMICFS